MLKTAHSEFQEFDPKLRNIDLKFGRIDSGFEKVDSELGLLDSKLDTFRSKIKTVHSKLGQNDSKLEVVHFEFETGHLKHETTRSMFKMGRSLCRLTDPKPTSDRPHLGFHVHEAVGHGPIETPPNLTHPHIAYIVEGGRPCARPATDRFFLVPGPAEP